MNQRGASDRGGADTFLNVTPKEAERVIADYLRTPEGPAKPKMDGIDLPLSKVVSWFCQQKTQDFGIPHDHEDNLFRSFEEAAWNLARFGILRPTTGDGYQYTSQIAFQRTALTKTWLDECASSTYVPRAPSELANLLAPFRENYGEGFHARAQEAVRCWSGRLHLACCAMCGAAAESILLAAAIQKAGDEAEVRKNYFSSGGRKRVRDLLVGQAAKSLAEAVDGHLQLLQYWRDDASHGHQVGISESHAFLAIMSLVHFALLVRDRWGELTGKS